MSSHCVRSLVPLCRSVFLGRMWLCLWSSWVGCGGVQDCRSLAACLLAGIAYCMCISMLGDCGSIYKRRELAVCCLFGACRKAGARSLLYVCSCVQTGDLYSWRGATVYCCCLQIVEYCGDRAVMFEIFVLASIRMLLQVVFC